MVLWTFIFLNYFMIEYRNLIIGSVIIILMYICIRLWHTVRVNARPDSCEICDSKRKIKIKRSVL